MTSMTISDVRNRNQGRSQGDRGRPCGNGCAPHPIRIRRRVGKMLSSAAPMSAITGKTMTLSMRALTMLCAITLSTLVAHQAAGASDDVGVRQTTAPSKERGIDLDVTVWYPASTGGKAILLGESKFFTGTTAMLDAPIADGKFPLVLLSHGAGLAGTAEALSWIATPLARQGFVVAAPNHPGNGGPTRSAAETMKLWKRPADISETLNAMETDASFKDHIDSRKVGILGLSMGGNTALAIAGARIDPGRLARYCDTDLSNPSLCEWVQLSRVDLHALDMRSAGRDTEDKRVRFAMAIDPAPVDVL
jgi:predicted dienelactone hydrolase